MTGNPQKPEGAAQDLPDRLARLEEAQTFADREHDELSEQLAVLQARLGELTARLARIEASIGGLANRLEAGRASAQAPGAEDASD